MLLTVPEVVFQMIAFGFENVVVFIFNFPASVPGIDNRDNRLLRELMIGHKGVVVELFACFAMGDGDLAPIDQQGILSKGNRIDYVKEERTLSK